MKSVTEELLDFIMDTNFKDLPGQVVHECKRILLDCLGISLAGLSVDKGKISVALARRLGGPPEASIIGVGDKVSCPSAAFANGELCHAMEYCNIMFPVIHVSEFVLPPLLALAENLESSGRDLILAMALAHEMPTRLQYGMDNMQERYVTEGPKRGEFAYPDVTGCGVTTFGGAIGGGKLLRLSREKMAHAIGIAGYNAPVPSFSKWARTIKGGMETYHSAGWICLTATIAALLADMNYTGDQTVLEGEYGFWRYYGSSTWDKHKVTEKLGMSWRMVDGTGCYKAYPSGGIIHSALESFTRIIEENKLLPEDIDKVSVWSHPLAQGPRFQDKEFDTESEARYNTGYQFALKAHRVPVEDWQNLNNIRNPKIREFMYKVTNYPHPDFGKVMMETPGAHISKVEVIARGRAYVNEGVLWGGQFYSGRTLPKESRQSDEWLIDKFYRNAARALPSYKMDKVPQVIFGLEEMESIAELMKLVTL